MKMHYRKVIDHDIEINFEAIITTWKKIIAEYTIENEEEVDSEQDSDNSDDSDDTTGTGKKKKVLYRLMRRTSCR